MKRECITEAPSVEEAVDAALEQLGVQQDAVDFEVIEQGGRRAFGIGSDKPAKVRVWVKDEVLAELEAEESTDEDDAEEPLPAALMEDHEPAEVSDEDLDKIADTAASALNEVLRLFGIEGSSIEEYEGDEGEIILDVVGGDLAILIGRHGRTLDALQATVSAITTKQLGYRYPVVVDVEGYRHRRRQKVEDIARKSADRAVRQRGAVRLRPMTAYERRIVHVVLRNDARVVTASEGEEPFRQVVIKPR